MRLLLVFVFIGLFIAKTLTRAYRGPGSAGPSGGRWVNLSLAVLFIGFLVILGTQVTFVLNTFR